MLGGLDAADADACEEEPGQKGLPVGRVVGEAEVGDPECRDADDQNACCVGAVAVPAGGEAGAVAAVL